MTEKWRGDNSKLEILLQFNQIRFRDSANINLKFLPQGIQSQIDDAQG